MSGKSNESNPLSDKTMPDQALQVQTLRSQIDEIDDQLCDLLAERFAIASRLNKDKPPEGAMMQTCLSSNSLPALRPQRENEIIKRVLARKANSELPRSLLLRIWRLLMSATAFVQNPYSLAYLRSDLLCATCRGACFTPQAHLFPLDTEAEVVAFISKEPQAFALVSIDPTRENSQDIQRTSSRQTTYPWWRFLFSTHAPRILQAMPIAQENPIRNNQAQQINKENRTRVLLLGRIPNTFIDESACTKYFIIETIGSKPLPNEARCREISSLPDNCLFLLASHENMLLVECRESSQRSSDCLIASLQALGKTRHIGSTHDDWLINDSTNTV